MNFKVNLYEDVMRCLRAKKTPQRKLARAAGVPFSTVAKIAQGDIESPSVHTVQKLYDFFDANPDYAALLRPDVFSDPAETDNQEAA